MPSLRRCCVVGCEDIDTSWVTIRTLDYDDHKATSALPFCAKHRPDRENG